MLAADSLFTGEPREASMGAVEEEFQNGFCAADFVSSGRSLSELRRLTASLNGRLFNPDRPVTVDAEKPYSIYFTRALLNYCVGNASEAATLQAMQIDDPAVLTVFARQLEKAAQKAGMDEAELAELQIALSCEV
jgi:hypothetical protein